MKKHLIRFAVLAIIFIGALVYFNKTTNQVNEDNITHMSDASLPLVYFLQNKTVINELHGYTSEMDLTAVRDTITPVSEDRHIKFRMDTFGMEFDRITCDFYTLDGQELLTSEGRVDYQITDGKASASIDVPTLVEENTEYLMVLTVLAGREKFYYYTRILRAPSWSAGECLAFASEFHRKTFSSGIAADRYFAEYMDSSNEENGDLAKVTLDSSVEDMIWRNLDVEQVTDSQISIKEILPYYTSLTISYVAAMPNARGGQDYLNVEEDFRLRYSGERVYVLNYERRADQIFEGTDESFSDDGSLIMGIRNQEVQYVSNETGAVLAFVSDGQLWSYQPLEGTLASVFSFRNGDIQDRRCNWNQHEIKIAGVDDVGNIDFFVYGYMNRGSHEGQTGILIYHYDSLMHTIQELAYIRSDHSFELLKQEMCQVMYENGQGQIYLMVEGCLMRINVAEQKTEAVAAGLSVDDYLMSSSGRYIALPDGSTESGAMESIRLLDMKSDREWTIRGDGGELVVPLAFISDDLICGYTDKEHNGSNDGLQMSVYKKLTIFTVEEEKIETAKIYDPGDYLIGGVKVEDTALRVDLYWEEDGQYTYADTESIIDRGENLDLNAAISWYRENGQNKMLLEPGKKRTSQKLSTLSTSEVMSDSMTSILLPEREAHTNYYVYAWGHVLKITGSLAEAIELANEEKGLVLDGALNCMWSRSRRLTMDYFGCTRVDAEDQDADSMTQALSAMLIWEGADCSAGKLLASGKTMKQILEEKLSNCTVYELMGCDVECMLYYVSARTPVLCMTGTDTAVLLNGYTLDQVYYYDFETGKQYVGTFDELDKLLTGGVHRYLVYQRN